MDVEHLTGAVAVLERIEDLLLTDEARHNLALGILSTARAHPTVYPELHGWVAREGDVVVGAAVRTPPYNLVLARPVDELAIDALAGAIEAELPGVVGALPEVDAFAAAWAERGCLDVRPAFDQRIYALRQLIPPGAVPGAVRLADLADRPLVVAWVGAFAREALGGGDDQAGARVARSVDARLGGTEAGIALWEADGMPVSLAGSAGRRRTGSA